MGFGIYENQENCGIRAATTATLSKNLPGKGRLQQLEEDAKLKASFSFFFFKMLQTSVQKYVENKKAAEGKMTLMREGWQ